MFDKKKETLMNSVTSGKSTMFSDNAFLKAAMMETSKTTELGNGALKYVTTGSPFVDQFGKITQYKELRSYSDITKDMEELWSLNPELTLRFTFYIRMITRQIKLLPTGKTKTVQRGQGLKHESIMRMIWLAINHPKTFWKNSTFIMTVGSWHDIFQMLSYDLQFHDWSGRVLDWNKFGDIIKAGLSLEITSDLVKKYLPQIKSKSACHTIEAQANMKIAKFLSFYLFPEIETKEARYKAYRKLKASGNAHVWQQQISRQEYDEIDFNLIPGRALAKLVNGKFLENHDLEEKYEEWTINRPASKYTGYVYELMAPVKKSWHNQPLKPYQEDTINKQFYGLIETAKKDMNDQTSMIVVVDSSGSMTSEVSGTKVSSYDVAKSMALYFSYLLKGPFNKAYFEFNTTCKLRHWTGDTPVKNLQNDNNSYNGSTNFQSVADTFANLKKGGLAEEEFPTGILCISDGCFNYDGSNRTNFESLKAKLRAAGFSETYVNNFKVVLWDIPNYYYSKPQTAFEGSADTPNLYHMSGLDGSAIAFLMGTKYNEVIPKSSEELFLAAMNQEVLDMLEV